MENVNDIINSFSLRETLNPKVWENPENYLVEIQDKKGFKRIMAWLREYNKNEVANEVEAYLETSKIKCLYHVAKKLNNGKLVLDLLDPPTAEIETILTKMGTAFDLAYKRFEDLQKAEAQTREAQIEAALERVRSRSMAMHNSSEMLEVADVLFQQLRSLGGNLWGCGVVICQKEVDDDKVYFANEKGVLPPITMPHTEDSTHHKMYKGWVNELELYSEFKEGKELEAHYEYMLSLPVVKPIFENILASGLSFPTWQKWHAAYFKFGYLLIITLEPYKDEKIFARFAKVFDQAYTRFLDLQKAEAQTREARIEASLERVRSRSMAMHKSDELLDVISVVSEQLLQLDFKFIHVSFANNDISQDYKFWTASKGMSKPMRFNTPYLDIAMFNNLRAAQKKSVSFYTDILTRDEHIQWHKHLLKHGGSDVFSKAENEFIMSRGMARSIAINPNIILILANYASIPYSA